MRIGAPVTDLVLLYWVCQYPPPIQANTGDVLASKALERNVDHEASRRGPLNTSGRELRTTHHLHARLDVPIEESEWTASDVGRDQYLGARCNLDCRADYSWSGHGLTPTY